MELVSGHNLFALPLEREWVASPATQEFPNFDELGMNKSFRENIGALLRGIDFLDNNFVWLKKGTEPMILDCIMLGSG